MGQDIVIYVRVIYRSLPTYDVQSIHLIHPILEVVDFVLNLIQCFIHKKESVKKMQWVVLGKGIP